MKELGRAQTIPQDLAMQQAMMGDSVRMRNSGTYTAVSSNQ